MSRAEAARASGVTPGALWSIENGKSTRDATASSKYLAWLAGMEARGVNARGGIGPAAAPPPVGGFVLTEYRGLRVGDKFAVRTEPGKFTFLGLVRERMGTEYIAAYGGRPGYGSHRSFALWKVAFPADPLASDGVSEDLVPALVGAAGEDDDE